MVKHIHRFFVGACALVAVTACTDDFEIPDLVIGEGTAKVAASVEFQPLVVSLDDSRGTPGDAIKEIKTLTLFIYNGEGSIYKILNTADLTNLKIEKNVEVTMPSDDKVDAPANGQAEKTTCKASFNMSLPYGRYIIYAVANMGDFATDEQGMHDYRTPDLLKKKTVEWNSNVPENNQMFGYMTLSGAQHETSAGFDPTPVAVNSRNMSLHAWLKRAASKVTVVYDGSGLHNGIQIYIKSVTIKDIPKYCKIGENNTILDADSLISKGETIYYGTEGMLAPDATGTDASYLNWMAVNKGNGLKGAVNKETGVTHSETDQALYFYENLQGDYPGNKNYYKPQIKDEVGDTINSPGRPDYKDNIKFGTYIEVEAYYTANDGTYISNGPIKYRFMLGQDTEYNYNAYRNHHYKLTLGFKGYANQPDWHIDYIEEEPYVAAPPVFYVPYMYHQKSMFPIRLIGNCTSLTAEIIENNWAPYDPTQSDSVPPATIGSGVLDFKWARPVYLGTCSRDASEIYYGLQNPYSSDGKSQMTDAQMNAAGLHKVTPIWAGFLALQVSPTGDMPSVIFPNSGNLYCESAPKERLKSYFYGRYTGGNNAPANNLPQNIRNFSQNDLNIEIGKKSIGEGRNQCEVIKNGDGSVTISIPLWTRAKTLLGISGFSGNNPYDTYQRKAIVRYTAKFKKSDGDTTIVRDIPVYQVRRIVNPKGVWRKSTDNSPFHVVLTRRENAKSATPFSSFESEGAWKAYVSAGNLGVTLSGGNRVEGNTVHGDQGTPIDFTVAFPGVTTGTTACAIITVEYHGYTCVHNLFVRQGYLTPIKIVGDAEWSSFSLYSCDIKESWNDKPTWDIPSTDYIDATITKSPLTLGTFFKRANLKNGIFVKNNDRTGFGPLEPIGSNELEVTSSGTVPSPGKMKWTDIRGLAYSKRSTSDNLLDAFHLNYEWPNFKAEVEINGNKETRYYTVPSYEQFRELELNADYGIGVLYADGATNTSMDVNEAYGFTDPDNSGSDNPKGMRGVFVYNKSNANQIFFPLGANGIGRRTVAPISSEMKSNMMGYLRYGAVVSVLSLDAKNKYGYYNADRPIPYNLPASPGAIYWIKKSTGNGNSAEEKDCIGWDMNYFDMNFNSYDYAIGYMNDGDALPIRLVRTNAPAN